MTERHVKGPYRTGGKAVAEEGEVMLDGPDGIAISMTPDAAEETGHSLLSAAQTARGQKPSTGDPTDG